MFVEFIRFLSFKPFLFCFTDGKSSNASNWPIPETPLHARVSRCIHHTSKLLYSKFTSGKMSGNGTTGRCWIVLSSKSVRFSKLFPTVISFTFLKDGFGVHFWANSGSQPPWPPLAMMMIM